MIVSDEAWVTYAVNEESAWKALVLVRSLERVLTCKKVVVLASDGVPLNLRSILEDVADDVIPIKDDNLDSIKLNCFKLPVLRKCIFLDVNCFVLRNCDGLFETELDFYAPENVDGTLETNIFLLRPSIKTYRKLIQVYGSINDLQDTLENIFGPTKATLHAFSCDKIFLENGTLTKNESELILVSFVGTHPIHLKNGNDGDWNIGLLEMGIMKLWKCLLAEVVDPERPFNSAKHVVGEFKGAPQEPIAIIGMSCRYPGANNLPEFWKLLMEGSDAIKPVPSDRWRKEQGCHVNTDSKATQAGFLNCSVDEFDGKFFGISPMEMEFLDPQQRILLEVVWESLEDGGIEPSSLKHTYTGVFVGEWTNDYKELLSKQGSKEFYRTYMGNSLGSAAGRLSFILGLMGPSIGTESGCSSAMVAVDLACKSLQLRETNMAIAAGVNLLLHPFSTTEMSMVCSPDGHCKTFDANADGFGRAEGCGSLVLKRYSEALNDGDRIWAIIRGTGVAQEGCSRSLGTPTVQCEALAMKRALDNSGVRPSQVSYVETHGTGTPVGDPMEVAAIAQVYSENRTEPLVIGSVKTNVGHTESCSGITGIMKVVLSLQNNVIPPHRNFQTLNPHIKLEAVPAEIPLQPKEWNKLQDMPRIAGVSSFGITGTDAHAIIQETPEKITQPRMLLGMARPQHILTMSAKNDVALDEILKLYEQHLLENPHLELPDVAFTANTGRAHMQHRVAITGRTTEDVLHKLQTNAYLRHQMPEHKPKLCFLFTGQGSQYQEMAKSLYETSPIFKMHFDQCDKLLCEKYSIDIKGALWDDTQNNNAITRTIYSQTSIFAVEYSLDKLWKSFGIKPDAVLGHSLGEFAAACSAGILTLEDAVELVAQRSLLIESLPQGRMVAVKASKKDVDYILERFVKLNPEKLLDYAAVNSSDQTVLAGTPCAVEAFVLLCTNNNVKTHVLGSTHAFHSRDMDPILPQYREVASKITHSEPKCTYISGMEGRVLAPSDLNAEYWVRHTRERVNFVDANKSAFQEGCRVYVEIGPQPVLSALTMINCEGLGDPIICLPSIRKNEDEWTTLLRTMSHLYVEHGFDFDWKSFDQYVARKKVSLPFYPFQRKKGWFEPKTSMGMINGNEIHPLVGCQLPNATPVKMFHTTIDLKKVSYIKDHCIGSNVIFPGAGYLEMVLAAGHATTQCYVDALPTPAVPLTVENLVIESPLCINENELTEIQILASSEEMTTVGTKVSIYRKVNASSTTNVKWHRHAQADFSPFAGIQEEDAISFQQVQRRCSEACNVTEFYQKVHNLGLKFGETFKSIKMVRKGDNELIAEVAIPERTSEYLTHPVLIDSMIQAIMISRKQAVEKLMVPISIKKFVWFGKCEDAAALFVHCYPDQDSGITSAVLYNDKGQKLATMIDAQLIETTVDTILSSLEQQKQSLPNLYEDAWRKTPGPLFGSIPPLTSSSSINDIVHKDPSGNPVSYENEWNSEEARIVNLSDELTYLYVLQAYYKLGWSPEIGERFTLKAFLSSLKIIQAHDRFTKHLLSSIFVDEGILETMGDLEWKIVKVPPTQAEITLGITRIHSEIEIHKKKDFQMIAAIGEAFARIMSGKESALGILFPEDPTKISADVFYTEANVAKVTNKMVAEIVRTVLAKVKSNPENKDIIRFLEIGGGTGSTTKAVLPVIDELKIKYEYTFTDVSQMFFTKAKKAFEAYDKNMRYQALNIENDPKPQGQFPPGYFDFVIASNVLHATKDLSISVRNVRHLLKNSGICFLVESNRPTRHVDLIFGVLSGYWAYEDTDIRQNHTLVDGKTWESVFRKCDFDDTTALYSYDSQQTIVVASASKTTPVYRSPDTEPGKENQWIIFSDGSDYSSFFEKKLRNLGKHIVIVVPGEKFHKPNSQHFEIRPREKMDLQSMIATIQAKGNNIEGILYLWGLQHYENDQDSISRTFLNLAQILLETKFKSYPKCYVITGGIMPVGDLEPCNPSSGTLWGLTRSLRSEQPNLTCRCIDTTVDDKTQDRMEELFMELWIEDGENQVAYRDGCRYVVRFVATKLAYTDLPLPNSNRFALTLPPTKTFADLRFDVKGIRQLKGREIEIQVKAAGLNFRDVFNVLKPDAQFENLASNSVGADFSGVVVGVGPECSLRKVGDFVVGCNFEEGALPSHIKSTEDAVVPLPQRLSFAEGCTMPATFSTAYYCLVTIGRLQPGETILVHTASGGVGICAIHLAKIIGAKVVATAGNKRKRAFVRSMGVEHVFHSRNLSFGADIERVTEGRGIDMVLNSLTGPGFKETSLKACAPNARFVEMSKLSIWTTDEVKALRPDVEYTIVDLTAISKETWKSLFGHLKEFLDKGMFRPIPYVRFNAVNIREALTYLQKAKHVGKVVCIMPEMEMKNGEYVARTPMFNDRSTYIITGGLGGIGLKVMTWMCSSGAKNIVLVGRNPPLEVTLRTIEDQRSKGMNIIVEQCDVGDFSQCKGLIDKLCSEEMQLPTIRGVMHAAGFLSDAIIVNQTWDKFEKCYNAKVKGAWNLHHLTLDFPLEHFVMFSSVVALFGPLGQSNHAASNSFLDALTHYRLSQGLPALSINWGQWGQVGVAAGMEVAGLVPFSPVQGIAALEAIMKTPQRSQIAVLEADFGAIRRLFPQTKKYVEELKIALDGTVQVKISSEKFWEEYDSADDSDKASIVRGHIENILRTILKLDNNEVIDDTQNLQEMGLDSLMMVEMKNFLQTLLGSRVTVSASALQDCHNLQDLTHRIVDLITGSQEDDTPALSVTKPELNQLIQEDIIIPSSTT